MKVPALYLAGRYDETCPRATRLCHDALPGDLRKQFTPAHLRRVTQIVTRLKIQGAGRGAAASAASPVEGYANSASRQALMDSCRYRCKIDCIARGGRLSTRVSSTAGEKLEPDR